MGFKMKIGKILFYMIITAILISGCGLFENNSEIQYPEFIDETEVIIDGCNTDMMEPFIAKDGSFLFFNSLNDGINTSLFYATKVDDTHFVFQGEISGVNGTPPHLDAVASMDENNIFYFISTRNYPGVIENCQTGKFNNGEVKDIQPVKGNFYISSPGWIIMDAEISKDGNILYYVNSYFNGNRLPNKSMIGIAEKKDSLFNKIVLSDDMLRNVNDPDYLIYAPSSSSDGKELYFARIKKGIYTTEICVSVRSDENGVFSKPKKIEISGNTVEAPTLADDGKRLYYHKKLVVDGKYHIFTMERK
jgi:hypothetical protein